MQKVGRAETRCERGGWKYDMSSSEGPRTLLRKQRTCSTRAEHPTFPSHSSNNFFPAKYLCNSLDHGIECSMGPGRDTSSARTTSSVVGGLLLRKLLPVWVTRVVLVGVRCTKPRRMRCKLGYARKGRNGWIETYTG